MPFVFDDQALVDTYEREPEIRKWPPDLRRFPWRNTRALTHFMNVYSMHRHGLNANAWHRENVLLHVLNAALVALIFGAGPGLLFLVHPIAGGLCIYISIRSDLVMTAAALLSTWFLLKGGVLCLLASLFFVLVSRAGKACGPIACVLLWLTAWFFSGRI